MKKSLFRMLLASLLLLFGCVNGKTQSLEAFYKDAQIENVDRVIIQDGSTGASKTVTNHKQIDEFLNLIKDIEFTPEENQEQREGWHYRISLFDGDREFKFTLNKIDKTYYHTDPDIHPIVDDYYKQLDIAEE